MRISLLALYFVLLTMVSDATARDFVSPLTNEEVMVPGDRMFSVNGQYRFEFRYDSNLVVYRNSDNAVLWQSNTAGYGAKALALGSLEGGTPFGGYCGASQPLPLNLHLYDHLTHWRGGKGVLWCVDAYPDSPYPYHPTKVILENDGRLVLWQDAWGFVCEFGQSCFEWDFSDWP